MPSSGQLRAIIHAAASNVDAAASFVDSKGKIGAFQPAELDLEKLARGIVNAAVQNARSARGDSVDSNIREGLVQGSIDTVAALLNINPNELRGRNLRAEFSQANGSQNNGSSHCCLLSYVN